MRSQGNAPLRVRGRRTGVSPESLAGEDPDESESSRQMGRAQVVQKKGAARRANRRPWGHVGVRTVPFNTLWGALMASAVSLRMEVIPPSSWPPKTSAG